MGQVPVRLRLVYQQEDAKLVYCVGEFQAGKSSATRTTHSEHAASLSRFPDRTGVLMTNKPFGVPMA